jgi:hypothetical protein
LPQLRVGSCLYVFKSPESAVGARELFFGKAKLNHFVNVLIVCQIANLSF